MKSAVAHGHLAFNWTKMGKSKRKDRTQKNKKTSFIDEDKAKRKMKESILKVFRAHAHSPSGSGAILVNDKSHTSSTASPITSSRCTHVKCITNNTSPFSVSVSEDMTCHSPVNCQKQRQKRYRKSSAFEEKSGSGTLSQVTHHVKAVHALTYTKGSTSHITAKCKKVERSGAGSCITQNRLTRHIGLFNLGKKSRKVLRDLIPVPEEVQQDVDKTLQHILDRYDDLNESRDNLASHMMSASAGSITPDSKQCTSVHSSITSTASAQLSFHSEDKVSADSISPELNDAFSRMPHIQDIADIMLSELEIQWKKIFKGKDLFAETCEDLQMMLMQQTYRTPEVPHSSNQYSYHSLIPHSLTETLPVMERVGNRHSKPRSTEIVHSKHKPSSYDKSSCDVKSFSLGDETVCDPSSFSHSEALHSVYSLEDEYLTERKKKAMEEDGHEKGNRDREQHLSFIDRTNFLTNDSAISMLERNAFLSKVSKLCCQNPGDDEHKKADLRQHNHFLARGFDSLKEKSMPISRKILPVEHSGQDSYCQKEDLVGHSEQQGSFVDKVIGCSSKWVTTDQHHFQTESSHQASEAVVTEFRQNLECFPGFHGSHHHSQFSMPDLFWNGSERKIKNRRRQKESERERITFSDHHYRDFLDQLDSSVYNDENELQQSRLKDFDEGESLGKAIDFNEWNAVWTPLKALPPLRKPMLNTPSPPDESESLGKAVDFNEWNAVWTPMKALPPLRKPMLNTPSPPDKLSPHRLF